MKDELRDGLGTAWRMFVFFMALLAVILVYGTWPRPEKVEYVVQPVVGACTEEQAQELTGMNFALLPGPCMLGPDVFADNFDYPPDHEEVDYKDMPNHWPGQEVSDEVIDMLIEVENPERDPEAVGDRYLRHKAYGLLQIRKPYLDDVNRIAGTSYTTEDMKDEEMARWAAKVYLEYYGRRYWRKTGKVPTPEVYGRIHNGGPDGWMKSSTNEYGAKITRMVEDS